MTSCFWKKCLLIIFYVLGTGSRISYKRYGPWHHGIYHLKREQKIVNKNHAVKYTIKNNYKPYGGNVIRAMRPVGEKGRKEALICSIFQFMWFKYFHVGQFQAASVWLPNVKLKINIHNWPWRASMIWLSHTTKW